MARHCRIVPSSKQNHCGWTRSRLLCHIHSCSDAEFCHTLSGHSAVGFLLLKLNHDPRSLQPSTGDAGEERYNTQGLPVSSDTRSAPLVPSTGGSGIRVIRICPVLSFVNETLSSRAKSYVYYPVLPPENEVL